MYILDVDGDDSGGGDDGGGGDEGNHGHSDNHGHNGNHGVEICLFSFRGDGSDLHRHSHPPLQQRRQR